MSNLTVIEYQGQRVIDSREVAEMTGVRHSDLLESISGYILHLQNGKFRSDDFFIESSYQAGTGKNYKCYLLTRKGCDMVANKMTGEKGVLFTAAYVTKFEEMEKQVTSPFKIPQTYAEALRLAADQAETIEKQSKQLEAAKPKVEFFDAVANSKTAVPIGHVAKILGIKGLGQNNLFALLREKRVLMQNNIPYQEYVDRGYFRVIEQKFTKRDETHVYFKTLVYQRGIDFIRKLIEAERSA